MPILDIISKGANVIKKTGQAVKDAGGIGAAIKGVKVSNAEFNKTREAVQTLFREQQGGIPLTKPDKIIDKFIIQFKTDPHNVPREKIGANYQQEFGRLYDATAEGLKELRGPNASEDFKRNVVRWTNSVHPLDYLATLIKGAGAAKVVQQNQDKYAILTPFLPTMIDSLKAKGMTIPEIISSQGGKIPDIEGVTQLFYNNFVAVKSNYNFENYEPIDFTNVHPGHHLDEAIVDATIAYIQGLQKQKNEGKTLPKVLDKVAASANNVQDKLTKKAKETIATEIGTKAMNNSTIIIIVAAAVVVLLIVLLARR